MFVVLLAHAEGAEGYALFQPLCLKCRTEEVEAALVGVLGKYERDEVERIVGGEFGPSIFTVSSWFPCVRAAFKPTPSGYTSPSLLSSPSPAALARTAPPSLSFLPP